MWLEPVPTTHIERLQLTPDIDAGLLRAEAFMLEESGDEWVTFVAWDGRREVARAEGRPGLPVELSIPDPRLWSPSDPHLYDLQVILRSRGGVDEVGSYFGMRKFSVAPDHDGRMRLHLNNRPLFHYGPLDQGYWPDGLYTPPTEAAMRFDVDFVKAAGCNMLRKHVKVEPAQFYAYCDRQGVIVWQDMPNGGKEVGDLLSALTIWLGKWPRRDDRSYHKAWREDADSRADFRRELQEMVDHLYSVVSIGMWVPFNEGWGQFDANAIAAWLKDYDPTRPVDHASGWFDQGGGDFRSIHSYVKRLKRELPDARRAAILSEFGGYTLPIPGHLWNPDKRFGYGKRKSPEDLLQAYEKLLTEKLRPWIDAGLSGAVYTQLTDVEIEVNGWLTYDRAVAKMTAEALRALHGRAVGGREYD